MEKVEFIIVPADVEEEEELQVITMSKEEYEKAFGLFPVEDNQLCFDFVTDPAYSL